MATIPQIRGMLLEEVVLYLLRSSGYTPVLNAGTNPTLHDSSAGLEVHARSILIIPITTDMGWDRGVLSGVCSVAMFVSGPLSILMGRLCDKHGPRVLLTIYGCLPGVLPVCYLSFSYVQPRM